LRIVCFSDSHGNALVLPKIVLSQTNADAFVFLGDGEREFDELRERFPDKIMRAVRGNCDWGSEKPLVDMLVINRKRIFFAHGHSFNIKMGTADFVKEAKYNKADIALFGHTHIAMIDYTENLHIMNPGSPAQPRQGNASYGFIDITDAGIFSRIVII